MLALTNSIALQVIGVGGGGSNAVNRMLSGRLEGVDLFIINTDAQASTLCKLIGRLAADGKSLLPCPKRITIVILWLNTPPVQLCCNTFYTRFYFCVELAERDLQWSLLKESFMANSLRYKAWLAQSRA